MPKYSKFQYGIKQYGSFESVMSHQRNIFFLQGRIGIKSGNNVHYIYADSKNNLKGKLEKIRFKSNQDTTYLYSQLVKINNKAEKIRIKSNLSEKYITAAKGWG